MGKPALNSAMKTNRERRLTNARLLLKEAGGQKGMIEITGRSQSQISQLMGENAFKPIGDSIARSLESAFDKPVGWLDADHHDDEDDSSPPAWSAPVKKLMTLLHLEVEDIAVVMKLDSAEVVNQVFGGGKSATFDQMLRLATFLDADSHDLARGTMTYSSSKSSQLIEELSDLASDIPEWMDGRLHEANWDSVDYAISDLERLIDDRKHNLELLNEIHDPLADEFAVLLESQGDEATSNPRLETVRRVLEHIGKRAPEEQELLSKAGPILEALEDFQRDTTLEDIEKAIRAEQKRERRRQAEEDELRSPQLSLIPTNRKAVPVISWVAAGNWNEAIDMHEPGIGESYIPCPTKHSNSTYALVVAGDSMTATTGKTYPDGSIIFVDPEKRGGVVPGDRVIAKLSGSEEVTFKQLAEDREGKYLKPLNPNHQAIYGPFSVLGKVIGKWEPE